MTDGNNNDWSSFDELLHEWFQPPQLPTADDAPVLPIGMSADDALVLPIGMSADDAPVLPIGMLPASTLAPRDSSDLASEQADDLCWGAIVAGSNANCTADFRVGHNHFKNKFCAQCRAQIEVPVEHVRALTPELSAAFSVSSRMAAGFWKLAPPAYGGGLMRVVNNTLACTGPWLVLFKDSPPAIDWQELPSDWVREGKIAFRISKGTMVPLAALFRPQTTGRKRSSSSPVKSDEQDGGGSDEAIAQGGSGGASSSLASSSRPSPPPLPAGAVMGGACSLTPPHALPGSLVAAPTLTCFGSSLPLPDASASSSAAAAAVLPVQGGMATAGATMAGGAAATSRTPFMREYVLAHQHMAAMIEARIVRSDAAAAAGEEDEQLPPDELTHLQAQLALCRALLAAAGNDVSVAWRSMPAAMRSPDLAAASGWGAQPQDDMWVGMAADSSGPGLGVSSSGMTSCAGGDTTAEAGGSAAGLRVLLVVSDLGLRGGPSIEARMSEQLLTAAGASCTVCPTSDATVSSLDEMLEGVHVLIFSGHADLSPPDGGGGTGVCGTGGGGAGLAFARAGIAEAISADALTRLVAAHARSLGLVVLNGCRSLPLGMRLSHVGVPAIACWEGQVADEAAQHFGVALCRSLAMGADVWRAFEAGVAAVLSATELDHRLQLWRAKFALVCPSDLFADPQTGRLAAGHAHAAGHVAAGVPWMLRPLPASLRLSVPPPHAGYRARPELEAALIACVAAHRLRPTSETPPSWDAAAADGRNSAEGADGVHNASASQPAAPTVIVLVGGGGHGKSALAAWLVNDVRTQSSFLDGIEWRRGADNGLIARWCGTGQVSSSSRPAASISSAAFRRRRRCVVIDSACDVPPLNYPPETLVLVTTRLTSVAAAVAVPGREHVLVLQVRARERTALSDGGTEESDALMPVANDSEADSWYSVPSLVFLVGIVAAALQGWRVTGFLADPYNPSSWFLILITFLPYLCMLVQSPANEPLVRASIELSIFWWVILGGVNLYCAAAISLRHEGHLADSVLASVPYVLPLGFHLGCASIFIALVVTLAPCMMPRADAPPFRDALRRGTDAFLRRHPGWEGHLLMLTGNALPTSTYSYHLDAGCYFREPAAKVHLHQWKVLRIMQSAFAVFFLGYFAVINTVSEGRAAEELSWVPITALINLLLELLSQPKRRRRIRAAFFPQQAQLLPST